MLTLRREFGVAEVEADPEAGGLVEQGPGVWTGHLGLEEVVELGPVVGPPAGKEGGEGQFGEHDEIAAGVGSLAQQRHEPFDDLGPGVVTLDGAGLGCADGDDAAQEGTPPSRVARSTASMTWSSTSAPAMRSSASVCSAGL